jgi:hypothetical protein
MDNETIRALIQKYRGQIESLQTAIRLLESELGASPSGHSPNTKQ